MHHEFMCMTIKVDHKCNTRNGMSQPATHVLCPPVSSQLRNHILTQSPIATGGILHIPVLNKGVDLDNVIIL